MFQVGDRIVYGTIGVCRVDAVGAPAFGGDSARLYYTLSPLYQRGAIYIPVDAKVFMRPVISREEADRLIDLIPNVEAEAYHNSVLRLLSEHYETALHSHDCEELLELIMSIYAKKQDAEDNKHRIGQVDERFMKRAEELFHGELAVALDITPEEVPSYIAARMGELAVH